MPAKSVDDLCESIERLIREHQQACLEQVTATVARCFRSPARPAARLTKSAKPEPARTSRRRTHKEIMAVAERFHEAVCERPGETIGVLAKQLGMKPRELETPVIWLRRAHLIRRVGERKGARYFPMVNGKSAQPGE